MIRSLDSISQNLGYYTRNNFGDTPLHIAATNGRLEIVQLIIQNAVEKNPVNDFGNTPLHLAATHGHLEASRVILKNTSDCSPENNFGKTPLEFARKNGHTEVCKFLEDKSHSLNICTQ